MQKILERLIQLSDAEYRDFTKTLTPTSKPILGVRIPALRSLAKELAAREDWRSLLSARSDFFEQDMLKGMIIGCAQSELEEKLELISNFVREIDNWNVCDAFCSSLKFSSKFQPQVFSFIAPYVESTIEFHARFGVVMLKDYFINQEYIDRVIMLLPSCRSEAYYARMGTAWAICECIAKFEDKALPLLLSADIDESTRKMAMRKCFDSRRVSINAKQALRGELNNP